MCKRLIYLILLLLVFASCEEYYHPAIDVVDGQLIVDAQVTNDPAHNYVRLTKTSAFYSQGAAPKVTGAKVELMQISGSSYLANETSTGNYTFNVTPVSGKNYKLRITVQSDVYESDIVAMPPVPSINLLYNEHVVQKQYRTDGFGKATAYDVAGRQVYIDAPVTSTLSHYRFNVRSILEWIYNPPAINGPPPPEFFGWQAFNNNSSYNLAAPKQFIGTDKIEKHPLLMISYKISDYMFTDTLVSNGWILIIDQFGTSTGSYDFHTRLNNQFAATGNLFDPVQTQVFGNINCKSDPAKIVYGYFDLNSYRQYRYFLKVTNISDPTLPRQIFRYPDIPDSGFTRGFTPSWWE